MLICRQVFYLKLYMTVNAILNRAKALVLQDLQKNLYIDTDKMKYLLKTKKPVKTPYNMILYLD